MAESKTIVLTGVTRGLGRALAQRLIELHHTVIGCGRSSSAIEELRQSWKSPHRFDVVDVADPESVQAWAEAVLAERGAPDLLINNAAVVNDLAPLWEVPIHQFSQLMDINVKGVFYCLRAFVPAMVEQESGIVVNFSSGWGRSVSRDVAPYCASKYAIEGLSKALAEELPRGMAVVPLNPGMIDTAMLRTCFGESAGNQPAPEEWARAAAEFILNISPRDNGQSLSV